MNIGIIGAGNVGGTLGNAWAGIGHKIKFGLRKPSDEKAATVVKKCGPNASAGSIAEAASFGQVVVLTTPWDGTKSAIESAGNVTGKIVIDCTNPLPLGANLLDGLSLGHSTSAGEEVARWAKGAKVVKAFNTTGAGNMANPRYGTGKAVMFIAGDDSEAKRIVTQLSDELGFETVDAGPLKQARLLEPVAMLWITLAYAQGVGPNFAFQLLKR
ncbi:MAG TPA: NADPH-dependent F420 reductase [Patescibacteria group bacterium]|nr:NADPH-dependent F420 reductase [Patescibacteria group bacterium]